jgi:hypothetical protein
MPRFARHNHGKIFPRNRLIEALNGAEGFLRVSLRDTLKNPSGFYDTQSAVSVATLIEYLKSQFQRYTMR